MTSLFEHLTKSREMIIQGWLTAIQSSPDFATPASVSLGDLMDHMPDVYDDMVDYLRVGIETPQARRSSDLHSTQRWMHHFRISDLAREVLLLRSVVSDELDRFQAALRPLEEAAEQVVRDRLTEYFDKAVIDSVRQFTSDQNAYSEEHQRVLADRTDAAESTAEDLQKADGERLRLLRVIAHELRNFLNAASLISEALREEDDPQARKEMEATLERNHRHMGSLLNELLEAAPILSGHEPLQLAPLDLFSFARQEALSLERLATAKNLSFRYEVAPDIGEVTSDEAKLRRVVINLVQNAIKYTDVGSVEFAVRRHDASQWELRVSDTGPGIPPDHHSQIYNEFHRIPGSAQREGAGLGLAIVRHLVGVLGGQIRVESKVGQGTSFYVLFPHKVAD